MNKNTPIFICVPPSKGRYMRLERLRLGLRQQDLANYAGVNQSYISKAELDKYVPYYVMEAIEDTLRRLTTPEAAGE